MKNIKSICVFSGSRAGIDPEHEKAARRLGHLIAERGIRLIYGGGDIGLMSIVARAALEKGGDVVGVIPDFIQKFEVGNPGLTELIVVDSMHDRKRTMFEMADGFVSLPGGLGTMDETLEIITWKQLQQHNKPLVLVDVNNYWRSFRELIQHIVDFGYGHHGIADLFSTVESVDDIFDALASAPDPDMEVLTSHL